MPETNGLTPELIAAAKAGDSTAMAAVLKYYLKGPAKLVSSLIPTTLAGRVSADDIVQEVANRISEKLATFKQKTPRLEKDFRSWTTRIATRRVQSHLRRRANLIARIGEALLARLQDAGLTPSRGFALSESKQALHRCLQALSEEEFDMIGSHYLDGHPDGKIAERLGLSEAQVRGRRGRAMKRLKDCLGPATNFRYDW